MLRFTPDETTQALTAEPEPKKRDPVNVHNQRSASCVSPHYRILWVLTAPRGYKQESNRLRSTFMRPHQRGAISGEL
jgi:hypothetical protein